MAFKFVHYKGPSLERLFRKWDKILSRYEDESEDLPYWYLERTNIGHLALAVYQLGDIPIQEFTCRKGKGAKISSGRADLYMSVPNGSGGSIDFNIEAKQAWCSIRNPARSKAILKRGLGKAVSDCRRLKDEAFEARYGAGILFLLPYGKCMPDDIAEIRRQQKTFTQLIEEESRRSGANFAALHFPAINTQRKISKNNADSDWCPGIAVVGKLVP